MILFILLSIWLHVCHRTNGGLCFRDCLQMLGRVRVLVRVRVRLRVRGVRARLCECVCVCVVCVRVCVRVRYVHAPVAARELLKLPIADTRCTADCGRAASGPSAAPSTQGSTVSTPHRVYPHRVHPHRVRPHSVHLHRVHPHRVHPHRVHL